MAIIGTAYVEVRAITDKINSDIQKSLSGNNSVLERAGADMSAALERGLREGGVDLNLHPNVDHDQFDLGVRDVETGLQDVTHTAEKVGRDVENTMGGAGSRAGKNFIDKFDGNGISSHLQRIFGIVLIGTPIIGALVSAISALVSGLFSIGSAAAPALNTLAVLPGLATAAVSGIGALALGFSGVGAAFKAGSKAAIAGAGAVGGAAKQAVKKVAVAVQGMPGDPFKINWELPEQKALRDAMEQTSKAVSDAVKNVSSAQSDYNDALKEAKDAEDAVTQARKDAIATLRDLSFAATQASIDQAKAVIALQKAQKKYNDVAALPINSQTRQSALLDLQQAQLNLDEATQKNADAQDAQTAAQAKGVEGSDAVVAAKAEEVKANQKVLDSADKLQQAQADLTKAQRDQVEQVADAQKNLADALKGTASAAGSAGRAASAFDRALAALSPSARTFVLYLLSIQDQFKALKEAAGEEMFPKLTTAIQTLINGGFLKTLADLLRVAGGAIGDIAIKIANLTQNDFFKKNFSTTISSNAKLLGDMGTTLTNLIQLFFAIAAAAKPVTEEFADWIAKISGDWATSAEKNFDKMSEAIKKGAEVAKQLGKILGLLWDSIRLTANAARPAGQTLLDSFQGALQKLKDLLELPKTQDTLKKYFDDVAKNVEALGRLFNAVALEFGKLGSNAGLKGVADQLTAITPALGETLSKSLEQVGPTIAHLVGEVSKLLESVAGGGGLKAFISTLDAVATAVNSLHLGPAIALITTFVGAFKAVQFTAQITGLAKVGYLLRDATGNTKAFIAGFKGSAKALEGTYASAGKFGKAIQNGATYTRVFVSEQKDLIKSQAIATATWVKAKAQLVATTAATLAKAAADKVVAAATKAWTAIQAAFNLVMDANPIMLIVIAIAALVAGFIYLWTHVKGFREFFQKTWKVLQEAIKAVVDWVKKNWPLLISIILGPIGIITALVIKNWDTIKKAISVAIDFVVKVVTTGLKILIAYWTAVWEGIRAAAEWVWNAIVDYVKFYINLVVTIVTTVLGALVAAWNFIWNALKDGAEAVWNAIVDAAKFYINLVVTVVTAVLTGLQAAWNFIWNGIQAAASAVWNAIVGIVQWGISLVLNIVSGIANTLSSVWSGIWNGIKNTAVNLWNGIVGFFQGAVGGLGNVFSNIASAISSPFKSAFNGIVDFWNNSIGKLSWKVPNWIPGIGGNEVSAPKLPHLALGGVVQATPGGVAAILGEAGKNEQVKPLNSNGLSDGEQAILSALQSNQGRPVQIVINAAPGMDIQTLAKEVSRQLAFTS